MTRALGPLVAVAVFVADQLSKWAVTGPLGIAQSGDVREIVEIFALRFVPNFGVSLGLLPAEGDAMRWTLVALTSAIACGVAWWMAKERNRQDVAALGMVLGGAVGNILDRIRFGYVVDFADLHFGDFRPFLVFNVADAAITIGVLILLVRALFTRDPKQAASVENENA